MTSCCMQSFQACFFLLILFSTISPGFIYIVAYFCSSHFDWYVTFHCVWLHQLIHLPCAPTGLSGFIAMTFLVHVPCYTSDSLGTII